MSSRRSGKEFTPFRSERDQQWTFVHPNICPVHEVRQKILAVVGPQVAGEPSFSPAAALGKVLILAREEIVAALLGLMVELRGLDPVYLDKAEIAEEVIRRDRPTVVVIDCDHQDCTESLLAAVREAGAKPILFSPFRFAAEVKRVAGRHGVESFTLPADPDTFGQLLRV